MNWRIKGVVQKCLSTVPGGARLNDVLQRTVGGLRNFEANVSAKVNADWVVLLSHITELGIRPQGLRYVEIGTGWYPTLPVCFHLAGAGEVITYDLRRHLHPQLTARMLRALEAHLPAIATAAARPLEEVAGRYQALLLEGGAPRRHSKSAVCSLQSAVSSLQSTVCSLRSCSIAYRAPADAAATGLPEASVDVVFSNSVLEHVPQPVIRRLLAESARILRPGGLSIHSVNCGDHYAYLDHGITAINYLTYTARDWAFWNNDLQYQNRLRPADFLELAEAAGLEIVLRRHKPRADLLAALPRLKIAPEFQRYPPEQLGCTSVDFVARKRGVAASRRP